MIGWIEVGASLLIARDALQHRRHAGRLEPAFVNQAQAAQVDADRIVGVRTAGVLEGAGIDGQLMNGVEDDDIPELTPADIGEQRPAGWGSVEITVVGRNIIRRYRDAAARTNRINSLHGCG